MTRTMRSRRASKDVQSLSLGPALRGLGHTLGACAAPRVEFRIDLRQRLIEEARLIALQPKTGPPKRRPRRPKGGGIRLAAIGIGFSLAGGGIVAAAHSLTLPARPGTAAVPGSPSPPTGVHRLPAHGPPGVISRSLATGQAGYPALARRPVPLATTARAAPSTDAASAVTSLLAGSATPTLGLPSLPLSPPPSQVTISAAPQINAPGQHEPGLPTLLPSWLDPSPSFPADPFPEISPLR